MLRNKTVQKTNIEQEKDIEKKLAHNFVIIKTSIKLPKIIVTVTKTVVFIANRKRDEIFNDFIVNELECYSHDLNMLIRFILSRSGILKRLRVGVNQYYGREKIKKKSNKIENEGLKYDYEIIDISLKFPKRLLNFINIFCEISEVIKENLFSLLIITRFEYTYSEPEILFDYINKESGFFEDLKEGINYYYRSGITIKKT